MSTVLAWLKRHGPAVFGLLLLGGALYVVQREVRQLKVADIGVAMRAIPHTALWISGGCTVLAYLVLMIYDRLGSIYAGHKVSWTRSFVASFCGYSLAHNLGFATVSGAAVRYRLYSAWGLAPVQIAKVVGFTSLTYGLGATVLGGLVLALEPEVVPYLGQHLPRWALQLCAIPMLAFTVSYITLSLFLKRVRAFGHEIELPGPRMALVQTLLAAVDVAITTAIFYTLLPPAEGLTFLRFVGIYLAAYSAGLLAHVPGGLGVFDGAILIGLAPFLPAPHVIGALLVFRLYYYIIPLFGSGALFAGFEISERRGVLRKMTAVGQATQSLEVPVATGLVALAGALLLFLATLPVQGTVMEIWLGHSAALVSQFAASVVGSLLLVMAFGLWRRLSLACWGAAALLLGGAVIAWGRGEAWWLWGGFLLLAALLPALRHAFYRHARLTGEPLTGEAMVALLSVTACGITLGLLAYDSRVADESWWEVVLSNSAPDSLRFTVGRAGVLLLVGLARLLLPARLAALPWSAELGARLAGLGAPSGSSLAGPADGAVFGERDEAGICWLSRPGVWLALGDPVGAAEDAISAIWRFRDLCERNRVDPAFWAVGPEYLRVYADIGLTAVPLDQAGGQPRYLLLRAERDLERLDSLLPPELRRQVDPTAGRGR